jgi:hypothetical protein
MRMKTYRGATKKAGISLWIWRPSHRSIRGLVRPDKPLSSSAYDEIWEEVILELSKYLCPKYQEKFIIHNLETKIVSTCSKCFPEMP